jgi:hypothetical protein
MKNIFTIIMFVLGWVLFPGTSAYFMNLSSWKPQTVEIDKIVTRCIYQEVRSHGFIIYTVPFPCNEASSNKLDSMSNPVLVKDIYARFFYVTSEGSEKIGEVILLNNNEKEERPGDRINIFVTRKAPHDVTENYGPVNFLYFKAQIKNFRKKKD